MKISDFWAHPTDPNITDPTGNRSGLVADEIRENLEPDERMHIPGVGIGREYAQQRSYQGVLPDGITHQVDDEGGYVLFPTRARDMDGTGVSVGATHHPPTLDYRMRDALTASVLMGSGMLYTGPGVIKSIAVWNETAVQVGYRFFLRDRNSNGVRIWGCDISDSYNFTWPNDGLEHHGLYVELLNTDYTPMTVTAGVRVAGLGAPSRDTL